MSDDSITLVAQELRIDQFLAEEGVHTVNLNNYLRDLSLYTEQSKMIKTTCAKNASRPRANSGSSLGGNFDLKCKTPKAKDCKIGEVSPFSDHHVQNDFTLPTMPFLACIKEEN